MVASMTSRKRIRKDFGRIDAVAPMPNLIEVQKSSYDAFLQDLEPKETSKQLPERKDKGLQAVFKSVFPIQDFAGKGELAFSHYVLEPPKYDVEECRQRGMTFSAPIKVTLRLTVFDVNEETGSSSIRNIKEQEVYMGDMPLMTKEGTFVVNGTDRVIVSQMHRSPGVFFDHDKGKTHASGKYLFAARVIPYRGSWLDFEFDVKDILHVRIDRRRKLPVTTLLQALDSRATLKERDRLRREGFKLPTEKAVGMDITEILQYFYDRIICTRSGDGWKTSFNIDRWLGEDLTDDLKYPKVPEKARDNVLAKKGERITPERRRELERETSSDIYSLLGEVLAEDVKHPGTDEILAKKGERITPDRRRELEKKTSSDIYSLLGEVLADDVKHPGTGRVLAKKGERITPDRRRELEKKTSSDIYSLLGEVLAEDLVIPGTGRRLAKKGDRIKLDRRRELEREMSIHIFCLRGDYLPIDLKEAGTGRVLAHAGDRLIARRRRELGKEDLTKIKFSHKDFIDQLLGEDIIVEKGKEKGKVIFETGHEINDEVLSFIDEQNIDSFEILLVENSNAGPYVLNTVSAHSNRSHDDALMDIYRVIRPGEPPTPEAADSLFRSLFFDPERYDLSAVGRVKLNARLGLKGDDSVRILQRQDILEVVRTLVQLRNGHGEVDDIDHLGNRRVRSVGELLENQFRIGLTRMERAIRERMGSIELDPIMPHDLINAKPVSASVREFFGSSQLSQFMDQTNPLSEITHKRRLSALGPGGLSRERAGFEVRDVHPTHYGRICPIETPEGPNIGLINSLATYARVNQYGFIETPYRVVRDGTVTSEVVYHSAIEEGRYKIAQANALLDGDGRFLEPEVSCRAAGDFIMVEPGQIDLIDVSPKQLVSVAAALIPFLENDDANRALMGSNMQRQAVPLIQSRAPIVGTGMEEAVALGSGASVVARRSGIVDQVESTRIVVQSTDDAAQTEPVDIYNLLKFQRSNQNTCISQRPLVRVGDRVEEGDIVADGPSTDRGELALGRNVLVAFMPWHGYNFEDSILISERVVRDDVFTSIHIEEFEIAARDLKLGQEEITRDIPNVGEEALRNLDEAGIVYIGAEVNAGDILVGKVTPKGESPMTPEEKLLRAIFGEKASDVRDTSKRLPAGVSGTVVEVRVFSRRGIDKDERAKAIEREEIDRLAKDRDDERKILERSIRARLETILLGHMAVSGGRQLQPGTKITQSMMAKLSVRQLTQITVADEEVMTNVEAQRKQYQSNERKLTKRFESKVEKLQGGDELQPGVMKVVKVFVAVKRKLQPGDKMAGRHGNKGVISKIAPIEDMPYLEDGTPVDIVLNPLGVPSRMNVGQILETHLGWAAAGLGHRVGAMLSEAVRDGRIAELRQEIREIYGEKTYDDWFMDMDDNGLIEFADSLRSGVPMATPVFDGARLKDIEALLQRAGLDVSGQVQLSDGRTGEVFERPVTVGYIYMMKLHHLVDDKIHARSTGPYSLVTQQPLGGKALFGGQRFGEMEVWALEAYGAAYALQEMLTVKSDDVPGRTKTYEAMVRGDDTFEAGVPESFNVLVKELKSLGLNVELNQGT